MTKSKTPKLKITKSGKFDRRSKVMRDAGIFGSLIELVVDLLFSLIGFIVKDIVPALFSAVFIVVPRFFWRMLKSVFHGVRSKKAAKSSKK